MDRTVVADQAAQEVARFLTEHRRALLRVAVGVCHDPTAAEDLFQETALRVFTRWDAIRTAAQPFAYVRQTMVRIYLNEVRRKEVPIVRNYPLDNLPQTSGAGIDSVDAALSLLKDVSPRARAVLTLRYIEDLDDRAVAEILQISRSTVRVTAHRALKKLAVTPDARSRRSAGGAQ